MHSPRHGGVNEGESTFYVPLRVATACIRYALAAKKLLQNVSRNRKWPRHGPEAAQRPLRTPKGVPGALPELLFESSWSEKLVLRTIFH